VDQAALKETLKKKVESEAQSKRAEDASAKVKVPEVQAAKAVVEQRPMVVENQFGECLSCGS